MLVLTRKAGECVRVGEEVRVEVLGIRGGQVSLGFSAPGDVRIYREEIYRTVESENQKAALSGGGSMADAEQVWRELEDGRGK